MLVCLALRATTNHGGLPSCLIWMPLTSNEVQEMDEYDGESDVEDMLRMTGSL